MRARPTGPSSTGWQCAQRIWSFKASASLPRCASCSSAPSSPRSLHLGQVSASPSSRLMISASRPGSTLAGDVDHVVIAEAAHHNARIAVDFADGGEEICWPSPFPWLAPLTPRRVKRTPPGLEMNLLGKLDTSESNFKAGGPGTSHAATVSDSIRVQRENWRPGLGIGHQGIRKGGFLPNVWAVRRFRLSRHGSNLSRRRLSPHPPPQRRKRGDRGLAALFSTLVREEDWGTAIGSSLYPRRYRLFDSKRENAEARDDRALHLFLIKSPAPASTQTASF